MEKLPILAKDIQKATKEDEVLSKVSEYISKRVGLLTKRNLSKELQPYFQKRLRLTIHSGCILKGLQVVIPRKMHITVMAELHETHAGMVKTTSVYSMNTHLVA